VDDWAISTLKILLGLPQNLWVELISHDTPNSPSDPDRLKRVG